jgi:2'-5' RNA ligase
MRLFIALNLPKEERLRIAGAAEPLREAGLPVRWVDSAMYHLTLKFLGEVRQEAVSEIQAVVDRVAGSTRPFDLDLSGFGAFPTIRRPRIIWLGVDPSPALRCLKQDLEWALSDLGFERETRAFHPHITLGRAESDQGAGAFRGLDDLSAGLDYEGSVPADRVDLMRSQLSRQGASYAVVHGSPLDVDSQGR